MRRWRCFAMTDEKNAILAAVLKMILMLVEWAAKQIGESTDDVKKRVKLALDKETGATDKVAADIEAAIKGASK